MKFSLGMAMTAVFVLTVRAAGAQDHNYKEDVDRNGNRPMGFSHETTTDHFVVDKHGGSIEIGVKDPKNTRIRDMIRQHLKQIANAFTDGDFSTPIFIHDQTPPGVLTMQEYKTQISYQYEQFGRGARIRITTKNRVALEGIHAFLRFQVDDYQTADDGKHRSGATPVTFTFIRNTSLMVIPVTVNGRGPYRFLLDTGASNSILSAAVADRLQIATGKSQTLLTAGGNIPVTVRKLDALGIGSARMQSVEIAVANFGLLETLEVDGILGGDYLRQFKVSIDYDNQVVQIEPYCPEMISAAVA